MTEINESDSIKVVEFGKNSIIGTVEESGKTLIVTGVDVRSDIKKSMVDYIKKKNVGELMKHTFRGKGNYSERPLTSDEEIHFNHLMNIYNDVEMKAMKIVVNDMFDQAIGNQ